MGRIKKPRSIEVNVAGLVCHKFGPMDKCEEDLSQVEAVTLEQDELQCIVYQDIDRLTMDDACAKMGVSKTVYAGIYQSARRKLADMILSGSILKVCTKSND